VSASPYAKGLRLTEDSALVGILNLDEGPRTEGHLLVSDGTMSLVSRFAQREVDEALAKVRTACLALPETSERMSHGGPAFFIRDKKCFVMFLNDHHEDGRLAIWCAAPEGVQLEMVETDPERFFRPPYVGHRGWLGVHLPGIDQAELGAICREAFVSVAPKTLVKLLPPEANE
jgi:hypothetical protein